MNNFLRDFVAQLQERRQTIARIFVVALAGSLFIAGTIMAMAPRVWGMLNAHTQVPPSLTNFSGLAQRSTVFDAKGKQIGSYQLENSQLMRIENVPADVVAAILALEDSEFQSHKGVNLRAFTRAVLSNSQGGSKQGASTITMQVVKNEFLAGLERDVRYKVLQARYATMLEKEVSKKTILERYLNTIYLGNNTYGLQAAAEVYFGKDVRELTLLDGAFLAGLIQAPSNYDPIKYPDSSRARYLQVIDRLVVTGLLTQEQRDEIGDKPAIPEVINKKAQREVLRTYYTEEVKDYLLNGSDILGTTYQQRYNTLFRGGVKVFTTLDSSAQLAAEQAVRDQLPANKAGITAAMVSLDVKTGAVRAMVGGPGFVAGQSEVNLALRRRQTGSSVKFFILAAALQAGVQPDDLIDGTLPCTLSNPGNLDEPFKITKGVSQPTASLRVMTWLSINCAYAKLSQIVGLERVVETTYRMASSQWLSKETFTIQPYASLATGANEMSPMDMAAGVQTLANSGVHVEPYMIERIEDSRGTVLYQNKSLSIGQTLPADVAINAVDVMRGVIERGTARRNQLENNRPAAGKTGTQDNNTNAWFVGFTPQYATAVWVGDPKGYTKMTKQNVPEFASVIGSRGGVQGAMFPAMIWKSYMDEVHLGLEILEFASPPSPSRAPLRLYLPGIECPARIVSGTIPAPKQVAKIATTTTTATTTTPGAETPGAETTVANTVVVSVLSPNTTISPTDLNPYSPVPTTEQGLYFYECAKPLPNYVQTSNGMP
ncbi:MAG: transglycosylase domain-containing protein [Actinomycetota bacterium]|nr:transglycosylase domain-containing protein [Actinomycetota bacterium]